MVENSEFWYARTVQSQPIFDFKTIQNELIGITLIRLVFSYREEVGC